MNKTVPLALASLLALSSFGAQALPFLPDVAVGVTGGTAGLGGQVTTSVLPFLNVRAQVQGLSLSHSFDKDGIDYNGKLKLFTAGAFLDVYPFTKGPRLSAGLVGNGNKLKLKATCPDTCDVGDLQITGDDARVNGDLGFKNFSPYLGLGFTNPMGGLPFYVGFDAGVLFHGRPKPSLRISGIGDVTDADGTTRTNVDLSTDAAVQNALSDETVNLADDVKDFKFYPVVQINLGWRF